MSKIICEKNDGCSFVGRKKAVGNRRDIFQILHKINKWLKEEQLPPVSTFKLVGSSKRNMIFIKNNNDNQYDHDIQCFYNNR